MGKEVFALQTYMHGKGFAVRYRTTLISLPCAKYILSKKYPKLAKCSLLITIPRHAF
jgi:hypothetical protein